LVYTSLAGVLHVLLAGGLLVLPAGGLHVLPAGGGVGDPSPWLGEDVLLTWGGLEWSLHLGL
jgi:hypothetical protein